MDVVEDERRAREFSDNDLAQVLRQRWEVARQSNGGLIAQDRSDYFIRNQLYAYIES
jgi:hypothetical protein